MSVRRQFSLTFLCLEMFWIALGLGLLTILIHAPMPAEAQTLVIPLVGASWGAAIGGLVNNTLEGAKGGLLVGFAVLVLGLGLASTP
jgi:hypothetical protein